MDSETKLLNKNTEITKVLEQFGDRSKHVSLVTADFFHFGKLTQPETAGKF